MTDFHNLNLPDVLKGITSTTEDLEFTMAADMHFGSLLRTLSATTLGGNVLQLGARSGLLAAWLLDGMPASGRLLACEPDRELYGTARRFLGRDGRFELSNEETADLIARTSGTFSLIVAADPAEVAAHLDGVFRLLQPGGLLVVGGLDGDTASADAVSLPDALEDRPGVHVSRFGQAPGVLLASASPAA